MTAMFKHRLIQDLEPGFELCEICFGVYGEESCFLVDSSHACALCDFDACCTRCVHSWRSQPMRNENGRKVGPGVPVCALCMTQAMLEAEAAYMTRHFRIAALAYMDCEEID